jgi:hypothetical protein
VKSILATLIVASLAYAGQAGAAVEKRFVIIVANNRSLTPNVTPLRYADDDGARWYELLAPTAARISLFTVLDEESQRLFRDLAPRAEPPTKSALLARLAEYNRAMDEARATGAEPVLVLVMIGHGEIAADGEGYLSLLDGPLRRSALFREVIAPSHAAINHVVIDACNSYLMVAARGADDRGPSAEAAIRSYLVAGELEHYPGTGVIVSTSRARASHEWALYGGGIFSHELRSALAGAADANGDGRIEYSEVRAYVAAANARIDDPQARLEIFSRPPEIDRSRPLADLPAAGYRHWLVLPRAAEGHFHLEDARGVRYADFNKSGERPLAMALVDSDYYFLRDGTRETQLRLDRPGAILVDGKAWNPRSVAERGAVEESFRRHLFEVPYGPNFYRGFAANAGDLPVVDPPPVPFLPSSAPKLAPLVGEVDKAIARARERGVYEGDDPVIDRLTAWAYRCARSGDLDETRRTLTTVAERAAHLPIDKALVERKIARASGALDVAPAAARTIGMAQLQSARAAFASGDWARANAAANRTLDAVAEPRGQP